MRITFFSNFLTHHQLPFCENMYKEYKDNFTFVATKPIFEERLILGFSNLDDDYDFVLKAYENDENYNKALNLAISSDLVIMGVAPQEFITNRLERDLLTFRYCERVFFFGYDGTNDDTKTKDIYEKHLKYKDNSNYYVLCASAYGSEDFKKLGAYNNRKFKWGYFPETRTYDINQLLQSKEKDETINILWAGRFIPYKHPEIVVEIAKRLKNDNYNFKITMLGSGILESSIKKQVEEENLSDVVTLTGAIPSNQVRSYMEESNIFLFTSDMDEGWGVVLNESMNSGCVVIANKNIGSVPFMLEDTINGFIYEDTDIDTLYSRTIQAIDNKELRYTIGKNAYNTIVNYWNAETATENLDFLIKSILNHQENPIEKGPAGNC